MSFGNILTIYGASQDVLTDVAQILTANQGRFTTLETTFFIETSSRKATERLILDLKNRGIAFTFFHNNIPTGSGLAANGLHPDFVTVANALLFSNHFSGPGGYRGGRGGAIV